jgi:hypothetical protein
MIRSSLVAIQLPLLKGAKNVVQGEGIVLGKIFHLTGVCRAQVFCIMCRICDRSCRYNNRSCQKVENEKRMSYDIIIKL